MLRNKKLLQEKVKKRSEILRKMAEKVEKVPEEGLRELAMEAQGSVGTVVELVDTVHRHKLAAKTNQIALATEVYNLKQKHKSLKKGSQALVKSQKKGKSGPLGGIAREITATLFPSKHVTEQQADETEKASAPPMEEEERDSEAPPSYEEPEQEAEANVTRAEVDAARKEWKQKTDKAKTRDIIARRTVEQTAQKSFAGFSPQSKRDIAEARQHAQAAWDAAGKAETEYHQMCLEYKKEEQESREAAGLCGPDQTRESEVNSLRSGRSIPSMEVLSRCQDGRRQIIVRERDPQLSPEPKTESLYPTLEREEREGEWREMDPDDIRIPKEEDCSTPKKAQCKEMKMEIDVVKDTLPTSIHNYLRIQDIRRVVIPLIPGNEIAWAVLTKQAVERGKKGEETMILQALMPQLSGHPEVAAQATMLLVQAANNPEKGKEVLNNLFHWLQSRYRLSPRQKRASFIQKLRDMQWTWQVNPADVLTGIMTMSQLTWDEVLKTPSLKEELEATMASKMDISLHLQITKNDPKEWRNAITEVWEKVKDSTGMKMVEIYMHEGEEDSDSDDEQMACNVEMPSAAVAQASLPKGKAKIDFRNFDKKLDMVVSALQAQEISKAGKPAQGPQTSVPQTQPMQAQNAPFQPNIQQPMQTQNMQDQRPPLRCYWCHQEGHMKRNCPQRNNRGPGNGYSGRRGWNQGRGNWNGGRGGYNQNRNNWNQNRGYGNNYNNNNWNNGPAGQGRGGYQGQNPQYRGYRSNGNEQNFNQEQNIGRPTWESAAERIRKEIIQEGRPKASWADPPAPPADDQPAIAADHAEANFVQGMNASERWKSETLRPPLMYEQAMAQLADIAPMLQPMEMPSVDFLGQR